MQELKKIIKKELDWAISHRRHLHHFPELSFEEKLTSSYCQEIMKKLGFEVTVLWKHGFIADLKVSEEKKTIAWRCELDALAISEEGNEDFISKNQGIAHMCGHDMHMAVALLGAKVLSENRFLLQSNIRFIFQPAEESPPGGALDMIANGCLEGVDEIYALHNEILYDTGIVLIKDGPVTAGGAMFQIDIKGRGTHVGTSFLGLNPIPAASRLIVQLYEKIGSKKLSSPWLFNVTNVTSGHTFNIIPEVSTIKGTIRSYDESDFVWVEKMMKETLAFLEKEGLHIDFNFRLTYSPTINSEIGAKKVFFAASRAFGEKMVRKDFNSTLCGEDFSYYLQKIKGAFIFLGVRNEAKKIFEPQHSPRFNLDEDAIALGAELMVELMKQ